MTEPASGPPVSLEDYAFVTAGTSDGLELQALLEHCAIDPSMWATAEVYWLEQLMDDLMEGTGQLSVRLGELQAQARASWQRAIPPLDDDLHAWVDWSRTYAEQSDPAGWLADQGLRPLDLLYLQQRWNERLAGDEALRAEQAELSKRPPEPVQIRPPAALALPGSSQIERGAGQGAQGAVGEDVNETGFVRALTDEERGGSVPFETPASVSPPKGFRATPDLLAPVPAPPPDEGNLDETAAFELSLPRAELPFFRPVPGSGEAPVEESDTNPDAGASPGASTSTPSSAPETPSAPLPIASPALAAAPAPVVPAGATVDETTVGGVPALAEEVLPFSGEQAAPPPRSEEATGAVANLSGTAFVSIGELDIGSATPFEAAGDDVDATVVGGAACIGEAVPFAGKRAPPPATPQAVAQRTGTALASEPSQDAVLPFVTASGTEPPLLPGGLTLRQLAALTVEMELSYHRIAELLGAYGLSVQSLGAHKDALRQLTATDPAAQARWDEATSTYREWRTRGAGAARP